MRWLGVAPMPFGTTRSLALVCSAALALTTHVAAAEEALTLHVLDCGTMTGMETDLFLPGVEDRPERFDMVNRCFLVVHPEGTLLWDLGFPSDLLLFKLVTTWIWVSSFGQTSIEVERPLLEQLAELGYGPEDIDYVAMSHSHLDHAGNANAFAGSTWLVQQAEYDWAFSEDLDNDNVRPELYAELENAPRTPLSGDHDVFGDGTVEILSSPGHTPGHQSLYLDLPQTGPIVLSGDLYHSLRNRQGRVPPSFNTDREQTKRSMARIEGLLEERGAELWIQHAPESGVQAPAVVR